MSYENRYSQGCKWFPARAIRNLILIAASSLLPQQLTANAPVSGDLAPAGVADGDVNVADVVALQRLLTGEAVATPAQAILADVAPPGSPDGVINNADLLYLRRAALGLVQLDTFAPQPISARAVTVDLSGGTVTLSGHAGSVEPLATVTAVNTRTGETVTVTADATGAFGALPLLAQEGDEITVTLADAHGNVSAPRTVIALSDPGDPGPFTVGTVEYLDPNGISGITDPAGVTGTTENVTLAWARITYPATSAGTGVPMDGSNGPYPVALFLHGRHVNCDNDGAGSGLTGSMSFTCPQANRIPDFEGYNYILDSLASYGVFTISISAHEIQPGLGAWDTDARARLILKFLDKLRDWNDQGTDPFGGIFSGMLDMSRIGISGHSRGGSGVIAAQAYNQTWPNPHSIVAVNTIAPAGDGGYTVTDSAYQTLIGSRDGDVSGLSGFSSYDKASPAGTVPRLPKSVSFVYGANHNYFNTIWTDAAALGAPNPWAGQSDDANWLFANTPTKMSASDQRQSALNSIVPFFRWQLQGIDGYRRVLTQEHTFSTMPNDYVFWSFQDGTRVTVDNFEQLPHDTASNTLSGLTASNGFLEAEECDYSVCFPKVNPNIAVPPECGGRVNHAGAGLRLGWDTSSVYSTDLPAGSRDVSGFNVLSFRAAKHTLQYPPVVFPGPDVNLYVTLEDGSGNTAIRDVRTDLYGGIPYPPDTTPSDWYQDNFKCVAYSFAVNRAQLSTIRLPLQDFTLHGSGVNLTDITRITLTTEGSEIIAIDDIEFGN